MRFFAVLAFAVAASATLLPRQDVNFPDCANPCILNADLGTCGADNKCLCQSQPFITSVTSCIQTSCTGDQLTAAETAAQNLCKLAGVTLPVPSSTDTSSGNSTGAPAGATSSTTPTPSDTASGDSDAAATHGANALLALVAVGAAALVL